MTDKGLVVTEEEVSGLPSPSTPSLSISPSSAKVEEPASPIKRSPIAELLYMRWLEGLKIRWPSLI